MQKCFIDVYTGLYIDLNMESWNATWVSFCSKPSDWIGALKETRSQVHCLPRPRVTPGPRAIPLTGRRVVVVDGFVPDVVDVVLVPLVLGFE